MLGTKLLSSLAQKSNIVLNNELASYAIRALPEKPFFSLKRAARDFSADNSNPPTLLYELQDLYLSDANMPSKRGRLVDTDGVRFPQFGVGLNLLRRDTLGLMVRGQALLTLVSDEERDSFGSYSAKINPLLLTRAQKAFFLFCLLDSDLGVIQPLFRALSELHEPFSDTTAGDQLPSIYSELASNLKRRAKSPLDRAEATQIKATSDAIAERQGKVFGKTVREQNITPRLEPYVDVGVFEKPDPIGYSYQFTQGGRELVEWLKFGNPGTENPEPRLIGGIAATLQYGVNELTDQLQIAKLTYQSWRLIASPMGYAPIIDVLLLASIMGLESGQGFFESSTGYEQLRNLQREYPSLIRFNVDRLGRISVLKYLKDPVSL